MFPFNQAARQRAENADLGMPSLTEGTRGHTFQASEIVASGDPTRFSAYHLGVPLSRPQGTAPPESEPDHEGREPPSFLTP